MSIVETIKQILTIIGVRPLSKRNLPPFLTHSKRAINNLHVTLLILMLAFFNISTGYFIIFEANLFNEYSEAGLFYMTSCLHSSFYIFSIWKRKAIIDFVDDLDSIVRKRTNNLTVSTIYERANKMSDLFSNYLWNSMFLIVEIFIFPEVLLSFYKYFILNQSDDAFQLLFPSTFLWEWRRPTGYLTAICIQCIWLQCIALIAVCTISLFVKLFVLLGSFAIDIKENLMEFNSMIVGKKRTQLKEKFIEIVELQEFANGSVDRFLDIYSSLFTIYFGMIIIIICSNLLGLNAALFIGPVETFRLSLALLGIMIYMSVLCMFGDEMTTHFEEIHQALCMTLKWNELPLELQKFMPLMLSVAQKPVYIKGYMSVKCTRPFMKTITNAGFSYFMMLRGFNH